MIGIIWNMILNRCQRAHLAVLEDCAAHASQGNLLVPDVYVFAVGENVLHVVLCLMVRARMFHLPIIQLPILILFTHPLPVIVLLYLRILSTLNYS